MNVSRCRAILTVVELGSISRTAEEDRLDALAMPTQDRRTDAYGGGLAPWVAAGAVGGGFAHR